MYHLLLTFMLRVVEIVLHLNPINAHALRLQMRTTPTAVCDINKQKT